MPHTAFALPVQILQAQGTHVKTLAGIICDSGAASIKDCQVFVELGITKPNSKNHSAKLKKKKDPEAFEKRKFTNFHLLLFTWQAGALPKLSCGLPTFYIYITLYSLNYIEPCTPLRADSPFLKWLMVLKRSHHFLGIQWKFQHT